MSHLDELERQFFKKVVLKNIHPKLEHDSSLILSRPFTENGPSGFNTKVTIAASAHGVVFFGAKDIFYDRFKLSDYKLKVTDEYLEIPFDKAKTKLELINYMNGVYLNSASARVTNELYDFFRSSQVLLKIENLKDFDIFNPVTNDKLILEVKKGSYLFEGSLSIKFV